MRAGIIFLAAMTLTFGACQRKPEPTAPVEEPPRGAAADVPAPPSGGYDAISNTAMSITGGLVARDAILKFDQGQRYALDARSAERGAGRFAATGGSWSSLFHVDEEAQVRIYRVVSEDSGLAQNGGMCGRDRATFLAVSEDEDSGGAPALFIAAFKGSEPPGPKASEASLCGTFMYAPRPDESSVTEK